ncbi:hypothetical protein ACVWZ4_004234 [Bradyrhizobium sp. USDA 4472]
MNIGKNKFLLSTAVLLAGVSLASVQGSAQGMREGAGGGMSAGGGTSSGGGAEHSSGAMSHGAGGASHSEGMTQGRAGGRAEGSSAMQDSRRAADKGDKSDKQTVGQAPDRDNMRQSQSEHEKQGKDQTVGQSHGDRDHARQSKSENDKSEQKNQTVGQSRGDRMHQSQGAEQNKSATTGANTKDNLRDKSAQDKAAQDKSAQDKTAQEKNATGRNAQAPNSTTTGANTRSEAQNKNAQDQSKTTTGANTGNNNAQGQSAQGTTTGANTQGQANAQAQTQNGTTQSMSGRVQLNAQQETRLQQSVLNSRNVERVRVNDNAINFRVDAGAVVPRDISVISVADYPALIDVYPDYRDDSFFVVDDEIVVTDRSRRIVDVIPAGPRTHYARRGSSSGNSSVAALDLSPDEIRIVQRVLIQRGMLSGEADGVLGPETRRALISFQRQEGFQASGSIDSRTVAALGVSNQISATQGQSTTVGQGGNSQSTPPQNTTGQGTGQSNAPAQQNQTTGQAPQNQPSTSDQAQQSQPANSGQASTKPPSGQTTGQAPAPSNNQSTGQPSTNQSTQTGQTNQNNAPPPSTSGQPAKK